jgi:capsular polysaccharide export protein
VTEHATRSFLFLQGPHGPFFHRLGKMLRAAGADVWRVGFNAGDRAFWFGAKGYIPYRGDACDWVETFKVIVVDNSITDIVLYGDTRPVHAGAVVAANEMGQPCISMKKATCARSGSPMSVAAPTAIPS